MDYLLNFLIFFTFSIVATLAVRRMALFFNIIDKPNQERKIHKKDIALLGGLAIFIVYFIAIFVHLDFLTASSLEYSHWLGFFIGALFLLIGGILDDKYNLKAKWQIIWPVLASLAVILGGVSIEKIGNPFGGFLYFPALLSSALIFVWILGMTYTTKLLDGLDGLATGVSAIGALVIFLFTISEKYYQADIALAAWLFLAVLLGFLIFNFNPAKIFLGESGSLLLGYILAVLAIISGGKIAIALLVMGLPVLDLVWTILRRILSGKNPFKSADRKHLHHRLLDLGLSHKQTVLFFYAVSAFFGFAGLFLQSKGKILALGLLVLLMLLLLLIIYMLENKKKNKKEKLLLHVCCAPCILALITDHLLDKYEIVLFYYNSNIDSLEEYHKRLDEVKKVAKEYNLQLIIEEYNHEAWLKKIKSLEQEPEKGMRCSVCYHDRLLQAALKAKELGIPNFYTSLLTSPYKDSDKINNIADKLAIEYKLNFLNIPFDKYALSKKSKEMALSRQFYCQRYCACEFSKRK